MECPWTNCARKFMGAQEFRRHCSLHVEFIIAAATRASGELRQKKNLLPAETWAEVLPSCGLESLKERVSLTRRLFHAIARPLLDGPKNRVLPEMTFLRLKENGADSSSLLYKWIENDEGDPQLVELPIAEVPPPQSVVGFQAIELNYFDAEVLSFMWTIRTLLGNNICLELTTRQGRPRWLASDQQSLFIAEYGYFVRNHATLECLFRVFPRLEHSITSLDIPQETHNLSWLARLLQANVRHLRMHQAPPPLEALSLARTGHGNLSPHIPLLVRWMHSPAADGDPKWASLNLGFLENLIEFVEQAQQHFVAATAANSVPYFVCIHSAVLHYGSPRVELPFTTLHNECTGEVLSLRFYNKALVQNTFDHNLVLYRRRSSAQTEEESAEADMLQMKDKFSRTFFAKEPRNRLVLNVAQMGAINESLYNVDLAEEQQAEAEESEPGSSNAQKIKLDNE